MTVATRVDAAEVVAVLFAVAVELRVARIIAVALAVSELVAERLAVLLCCGLSVLLLETAPDALFDDVRDTMLETVAALESADVIDALALIDEEPEADTQEEEVDDGFDVSDAVGVDD